MRIWITWALFFVCFVYNILDIWQTNMLLHFGVYEYNPIMNYFLQNYGVNSLYGVKLILFLWLAVGLYFHQIQFKKRNLQNDKC